MARELTKPDAGVTLIELLVVVAVLAVLAVGVSITAMRGSDSGDRADMAWFQAQFDQHQTLAITSVRSYGLIVSPKDLRVAQHQSDGWEPQSSARRWRARVAFSRRDRASNFAAPDIILLASGQSSAFDITFGARHTCTSDGWNGLTCTSR
ncbi:prepilin-type N-terminal cleavage/methylation domain-containing protein [Pseudosulfitobacter sp. SM2401]|uniref:prepilin-type N-terminal cleavage/methylation domain-containing protein n=1 Tax=Pseudosulfitobacter sp. SM2401 TaxID=3350098 RepID=UPI0036F2A3A1